MKKARRSLGEQIDRLYRQDLKIKTVERELRDLKSVRSKLEVRLLKTFGKEDIDGSKGANATANVNSSRHPQLKDPRQFWKYVLKNRATDLVHNRISSRAYFDRLQEGETIPGVEIFTSIRVSVRKRKK